MDSGDVPLVIARLEKDMETLTKAMATMADGMAKMADMHLEQQLMKQDFALKYDVLKAAIDKSEAMTTKIWREVDALKAKDVEFALKQQPNSAMTNVIAKLGWLLLGGAVATAFSLLRG